MRNHAAGVTGQMELEGYYVREGERGKGAIEMLWHLGM